MKNNFIQRTITGIIFVAVLVGGILGGPVSFSILFALITALTIREFGTIVSKQDGVQINKSICMLAGVFLFFGFAYIGIAPGQNEILIPYLFLIIYLMIAELYLKRKNPLHNIAYTMMSQMYIALPFAALNILAFHTSLTGSASEYNPILPLSIFVFTWINDTGAYCTGVLFGKHRLFERISPKKSWEGSIGGGVFSTIAAVIMAHFFPFMPLGVWIGLGLTVVVFGTWGDLTESLLKRTLGIKDSGNILPGHGGMLDRFDSTLMAVPASVIYLYVISLFK
ncbi:MULTISPECIES: phosphatidate cytidylyltransferase [Bacteroides]|uniref:Phosphatidate cytidylyltransferase n=1 Tax=Bacteroides gallinaceum TaxID=1462571 RepID=A0ABT7VFM4_9BACE|nr:MULTISPECIES: phosphatidate cytidylyltransferase [Bacteroides]MCR8918542.1 phosphatidate cytidylyltransferase [Bacteroides sp. ET225]MDM8208817.1 phosphatidate cytidylyltransferase [Bacteroides gallinaceum]MDM8324945.1 phosphatidate cytidylyltransferase [Bacteroides gallinaceum]